MKDEDEWIRGQGPAPPEIHALFDAMRAPPPMSADIPEELELRVLAAVERDRRREVRARKARWALVALAISAAGGAMAMALLGGGREVKPQAAGLARPRAPGEASVMPLGAKPPSGRP